MPFLLLLFLMLACSPEKWSEPWWPFAAPATSAALTWLVVALVAAGARLLALWVEHRLALDPRRRAAIRQRYGRFRFYSLLGLMATYGLSLYVFGWGWAVQQWYGTEAGPRPGAEFLILAPFLVGLLLTWTCTYDADRALHEADTYDAEGEPFWNRSGYVLHNARQNLALVLVPLLLMIASRGLRRLFPNAGPDVQFLLALAGGAMTLVAFLFMPWALRIILGLTPLPEGPLRDRLMASARRLNFRFSNILVWHTRHNMVNAMVAGVVPWVRYVLLTDRLLDDLTPDEIEAVFGHEVGHVKHYHIPLYLGFLLLSLVLISVGLEEVSRFIPALGDPKGSEALQMIPLVVAMGAYVFLVFGFLSRRCERQADVYGCRAVSCARTDCAGHETATELAPGGVGLCPTGVRTFIGALEKVARLNGISRDKPGLLQSWQHSTIGRRVAFLDDVLADLTVERRFQRRIAVVKWSLFLGVLAAIGILLGGAALLWSDDAPEKTTNPPAATEKSDTPV